MKDSVLGLTEAEWGLPLSYVRTRLRYASFVSKRHKYVYVETPKVACTTLKRLIHRVEDCPPIPFQFGPRESKLYMLVHPRNNIPIPNVVQAYEQAQSVMQGDEYFRFCFVRNPYMRLISAWYNKIWLGEPGMLPMRKKLLGQISDPERADYQARKVAHFHAFVAHLQGSWDALRVNHHWRPQVLLVFPDHIHYHMIGRVEQFSAELSRFHGWLRAHGYTGEVEIPRSNESLGLVDVADYLDRATAEAIYGLYRQDFERFGYDKDSWMAFGARALHTALPPAAVEPWESDIVERNEFLRALYAHLPEDVGGSSRKKARAERRMRRMRTASSHGAE